MYTRYCSNNRLHLKVVDQKGKGKGLRLAVCIIRGKGAGRLLGEGGTHSIQHITRSRRKDRIHTSTVTVACFPLQNKSQQTETKKSLARGEVRIDTFRGSGKGGQHRNKTDSAVRALHLPSGEQATVTSGRSQSKNREQALAILGARLAATQQAENRRAIQARRQKQTRAERSRAIRVYDLVRDMVRCGDGRKIYGVQKILDGDLSSVLTP